MPQVPWRVRIVDHPGSTREEIEQEPDWEVAHEQRVGYLNRDNRRPGLTHPIEAREEDDFTKEAREKYERLKEEAASGRLVNWRNIIEEEPDLHLIHPGNRPLGWRYVVDYTEDWVRNKQRWPMNVEKEKKEEEEKKRAEREKGAAQDEELWRRGNGEGSKHHDAYSVGGQESGRPTDESERNMSEYDKLRERYTPQEIALLQSIRHEKSYIEQLEQNDGKGKSPQTRNRTALSIDEADQFTPDNWLPRCPDLIRLTGKHPLNAEAHLSHLYDAGLITPNELHYVRNHGAVPRLLWEFHRLDVEAGKLVLSMDDLKNKFGPINIPIALACDGNRRKELNMIKRTKGFNWGAGAVSCAYWKGPLVRDVLMAAGVEHPMPEAKRYWVHFEGADELSEGKYATSIPFDYAMDPTNDVMLAYEMNNVPLPPDHGYPVRLMIPGYVGGRCVKWLKRIWISEKENDSHYHIWDNRVLPSFVTEKDGEFAHALFTHPDTKCNEQNLNSVITKPAHGEGIPLTRARKGHTYRIEGYAYDGGGHQVQLVEVSLDEGETWLYCIRKFPKAPIRHGSKFWTWLHWHVDVSITHLLQSRSITVRCFNVFKNTQPQKPVWNIMGMMNNCRYTVKSDIVHSPDSDVPSMLFRHPVEPGTGEGGWMKPSVERRIASAKQDTGAPSKQFTREEIEKHDKEDDCWIVVDGKVYDATSVLSWHPGGKSAIMDHAGKVHQETTDEYSSIHDDYAYQKLNECVLGEVTDKAKKFIKKTAEAAAKDRAKSTEGSDNIALQQHRWVPIRLVERKAISDDTRTYTFELPANTPELGLGTCQHIQLGFHLRDRMLIRQYTPTRPVLPAMTNGKHHGQHGRDSEVCDGTGTFDLTIKTYFPSDLEPGGAMSNILDCMPIGEEVEIRGPSGGIVYNGNGSFSISDKPYHFDKVSLVLGGTGITPGYSLIARILLSEKDTTRINVVDANKTEADILLKDELDQFEKKSNGQLKVCHVLSHAAEDWKGLRGHINAQIIRENLFEPGESAGVFVCGPPAMIKKASLPALKDWGYEEDVNLFGF
ncbi:uncharacterized protein EI97DRAFT_197518 [Westerdykella ornata]|uniref:Nitrate reductase [NADPH] n=1 Tax=Westerdykella ornata TaxID=318751 RepID=A0A6A6J984_WESOR|nr:uncharacterized protein EI97DRAFT_197518 [Westerdykella ornata]KAF2272837.1 hypothetical protein EI97DRAFT_197518 [Westerdykella ornata]